MTARDPRTGRWTVDTSNTPLASSGGFATQAELDAVIWGSSPAESAYVNVPGDRSIVQAPAAPCIEDDLSTGAPLHPRSRVDEYGLRDPFGRQDEHLVERAQAGTERLPGTERL